jgi:hypothetical protein
MAHRKMGSRANFFATPRCFLLLSQLATSFCTAASPFPILQRFPSLLNNAAGLLPCSHRILSGGKGLDENKRAGTWAELRTHAAAGIDGGVSSGSLSLSLSLSLSVCVCVCVCGRGAGCIMYSLSRGAVAGGHFGQAKRSGPLQLLLCVGAGVCVCVGGGCINCSVTKSFKGMMKGGRGKWAKVVHESSPSSSCRQQTPAKAIAFSSLTKANEVCAVDCRFLLAFFAILVYSAFS